MARKVESPTREVSEALGAHLDNYIPEIKQIIHDFPESNRNLKFPAISIMVLPSGLENWIPYVHNQGDVQNHKADVKYVVGQFNWSIALDIWERSKEERHDLVQKVMEAFRPNVPIQGLFLTLKNYHDVLCSYEITDYSTEDSEISSQRKEWRATLDVTANCKQVQEKSEFIVEETELTLETPDVIPEP